MNDELLTLVRLLKQGDLEQVRQRIQTEPRLLQRVERVA
jgi:hypothetical protein